MDDFVPEQIDYKQQYLKMKKKYNTAQKMKFSIKDFFRKCDLTFTEEILIGKLHFLCSVMNTSSGATPTQETCKK